MDLTDIYTIAPMPGEDGTYRYRVLLNPRHEVFRGHFPGQPVMPGVCMLAIIKDCVEDALGKEVRLAYIRSCKFTAVVDPGKTTALEAAFTLTPTLCLQATLTAAGAIALKLKAQLIQEVT